MSIRSVVVCLLAVISFACEPNTGERPRQESVRRTAILGAFAEETRILEEKLQQKREHMVAGRRFTEGFLCGRSVVLAESGIGKVNAAVSTSLMLEHFSPMEVIFTGIAGGVDPELLPGDVVIGARLAQHDLGELEVSGFTPRGVKNPFTGSRNPVFFLADSAMLHLAAEAASNVQLHSVPTPKGPRIPRVVTGTIVTGDVFVASGDKKTELRRLFQADAVEMEGAAVAQVCYQQGVPCLVLRSLSDKADTSAVQDIRTFQTIAARNSAQLVFQVLRLLVLRSN